MRALYPLLSRVHGSFKFAMVYRLFLFGKSPSRSGPGSDLIQTASIRAKLPSILKKYEIETMLDAPCGDLYWIQNIMHEIPSYVGLDIVPSAIKKNRKRFPQLTFICDDLCKPRAKIGVFDLILCRDLFPHLTDKEINKILDAFKLSSSKFLLTTTFPDLELNSDLNGRMWRPLNLSLEPFSLGEPLEIFLEHSTEDHKYSQKSLAIWKLNV